MSRNTLISIRATRRGRLVTGVGALAAVAVLGAGLTACGEDEEPKKVGTSQDGGGEKAARESGKSDSGKSPDKGSGKSSGKSSGKPEGSSAGQQAKTFKVGDRIALGSWEFTVHEVVDPLKPSTEFLTPEPGNRWVGVDLEVTNKDSGSQDFSSLLFVELKDSTNKVHDVAFTGEEGRTPPDGAVSAGESRRGAVDFEVPESAKGLTLTIAPDLLDEDAKATVVLG
ncbi:hypothetical protein GCM10027168_33730 [Streptomyces capparidis]